MCYRQIYCWKFVVRLMLGHSAMARKQHWGQRSWRKTNLQLLHEIYGALLDRIAHVVMAHPLVQLYTIPRHSARPIINRYEAGMEYGLHVDSAFIGEMRTDLSFTLFLDDAASYDSGELVMATQPQQIAFKLSAGSMVLYTTGAMHRVAQVTRGTRNAVVGWSKARCAKPDSAA